RPCPGVDLAPSPCAALPGAGRKQNVVAVVAVDGAHHRIEGLSRAGSGPVDLDTGHSAVLDDDPTDLGA
ncbi:hypothetical protein ABE10_10450, partial [Bacillus toyonensis]|nr:hypothetical protein [Bacillus toyonensis]